MSNLDNVKKANQQSAKNSSGNTSNYDLEQAKQLNAQSANTTTSFSNSVSNYDIEEAKKLNQQSAQNKK